MEVIPLTLAISLLLSLTFIALFVREFSRPRRAGADRESLLPFEQEMSVASAPREAATAATRAPAHDHDHGHHHAPEHTEGKVTDDTCASRRTDGKCCASCQRRKDRAAVRAAVPAASQLPST